MAGSGTASRSAFQRRRLSFATTSSAQARSDSASVVEQLERLRRYGHGRVWKTTDLGANWTQLQVLPTRWVNAIVVDPTNANHVFAAFSGYREGNLSATARGVIGGRDVVDVGAASPAGAGDEEAPGRRIDREVRRGVDSGYRVVPAFPPDRSRRRVRAVPAGEDAAAVGADGEESRVVDGTAVALRSEMVFDSQVVASARDHGSFRRPTLAALRDGLVYRSAWPEVAAALLGFSVLVSIGIADGGVFPRAWRLATLALSALAAAALLGRQRIVLGRLEWAVLGFLAAFAGWVALSETWSSRPTVSLLQAERAALYAVAVLAVLLVAERASVPHLLGGVVAGITVVATYGLVEYLFWPSPLDPVEGRLLDQPLGYANGLGIFVAIGILLSLGLAAWARRPTARAAALIPVAVLVPTLYLTSSRGAWLALAAGFTWLAGSGTRFRLPAWALPASLAAGTSAAVLVVASVPGALSHLAGESRAHYWQVAWKDYRAHPLLGAGAGTYGDYWLANRADPSVTRTAHSLYLQSLAELGPIGLLLAVATLGLPFARLRTGRDPLVAAATAGYLAYVLHAGIDWDWELPAATLAGLICGAALLVATRPDSGAVSVRVRAALLVPALALLAVTLPRLTAGPRSPFGP